MGITSILVTTLLVSAALESVISKYGKHGGSPVIKSDPSTFRITWITNIPVIIALLLSLTLSSLAQASETEKAVFQFGGIKITAILDATMKAAPAKLLLNITPEEINRYIPGGETDLTTVAFIAQLNGQTILFDTGFGASKGGKLAARLEASSFRPEAIDTIVITHMHPDHVGGLVTPEGKAAFPKAEIYIAKTEYDFWLTPGLAEKIEADKRGMVEVALTALKPYQGKIKTFAYDTEIRPGVVAIAATGHTAGHTVYRLKADNGELLIVGDLTHIAPVQMPRPEVAIVYDSDPVLAVKTRKAVFTQAAQEKLPVAGMHFPFPAIGRLTLDGDGFAFTTEAAK
ncbi:MAG: MBL fold metallo-hydrolase [Candidatus Adiutrix sp.]|jgi:glyoxylase-like metal-dependent hydrolase (beta-lactamase superfamily II)|nr:MBL fold metallo-hydrolase [Candidatus Adiutrix sp.]